MAELNKLACALGFGNFGVNRCSFIPKEIAGLFIVTAGFSINAAQAGNVVDYLQAQAHNPNVNERIYPVHNFLALTDNSEEAVTETFDYGSTRTIRDGNYNWNLRFMDGGLCLLAALQTFNFTSDVHIIFYDKTGVLIGTESEDGGLAGVPMEDFFAPKWTPATGAASAIFSLSVSHDPIWINQKLAFIDTSRETKSVRKVKGMTGISTRVLSQTASSAVLKLADSCSGDGAGFFEMYGADLDAALFTAYGVDGSLQTISAAVVNNAAETVTLTFTPARTVATRLSVNQQDLAVSDMKDIAIEPVTIPFTA